MTTTNNPALNKSREVYTLDEYLEIARSDPMAYASIATRLLKAIGAPKLIETIKDPRLSRIFQNKVIRVYEPFLDFYGLEEPIEEIVSFLRRSEQRLEESRVIPYLMGPPGGGKSTIVSKLRKLAEKFPVYVLAVERVERGLKGVNHQIVLSPVYESPLGLFGKSQADELGIPELFLTEKLSGWANKRFNEFDGDLSKFRVVKVFPNALDQIAIARTEPGDENNQDISVLVGKSDIRKLGQFSQDDPDSYSYSGLLNKANQGLGEFVEMFKAPEKVLNPLLSATQEGHYNGTETIGSLPFSGMVIAHSNEPDWETFRNNVKNAALIDRIHLIRIPYCLRISDEIKIYEKLLKNSTLAKVPCAPNTLKSLAEFSVLTRLVAPDNSKVWTKAKVYDGENMKEKDNTAKSLAEYKDDAGVTEGFSGFPTRSAFKVLAKTFNYDIDEIAANPVHLIVTLKEYLLNEQLPEKEYDTWNNFITNHLEKELQLVIEKEFQYAYIGTYDQYGQNMLENYFMYADFWLQNSDFRDPDTGEILDRAMLDDRLSGIEKPAGIANPKDFRNEAVHFILHAKSTNGGKFPDWKSYKKLKEVIEKKMFANMEMLLPVISYAPKTNKDDQKKHDEFIKRMVSMGYTAKQVRILSEWYLRVHKT